MWLSAAPAAKAISSGDDAFLAVIQRGGFAFAGCADMSKSEGEIILEIIAYNGALQQKIYTKPPQLGDPYYVQ